MPRRRDVAADGTLASRSRRRARHFDPDRRARPTLRARLAPRAAAGMTSERIARMEALFEAALQRPASERAAFLAAESDPDLRAAVARLLAHHTENDARLRDALDAAITEGAPLLRERVGPYRIVRELGAGGMGTVFLAERTFGETRQKVALKLIRDFPSTPARERLARESRLLAELNHPNIARLLDAGESDDRVQ